MKYRLLNFLACPRCGGGLSLSAAEETSVERAAWSPAQTCLPCALGLRDPGLRGNCLACARREVLTGELACACGCAYPILGGVPDLAAGQEDPAAEAEADRKTSQRFGYEWSRYPECFYEEEEKIFFEETQLAPGELAGRLVLDAGCGMGRFTRVAGSRAGEVIGVDLSASVYKAQAVARHLANVHIVKGDIMRLPLRDALFDIAYSLGVLHHTPDTRSAFAAVARKIKPGGLFTMWVYGTAGRYRDFSTNPLRAARSRYVRLGAARRLYWLMVLARETLSNGLRLLTVRVPHRLLYALCYGLALLGKVPLVKYGTFSVHADWRVRLLENFDWLAPPFQFHHTKEEVLTWYADAGFAVEGMLEHGFVPKVGVRGRKQEG